MERLLGRLWPYCSSMHSAQPEWLSNNETTRFQQWWVDVQKVKLGATIHEIPHPSGGTALFQVVRMTLKHLAIICLGQRSQSYWSQWTVQDRITNPVQTLPYNRSKVISMCERG